MAMTTNGMPDREQMNDRVRNGGSGMVYIPNGRVEEDESFVDERAPDPSAPGGDWDSLLNYQRRHQEVEQQKANQQILDGYLNIETAAKQRRVALNQNKAIAGAAAINSAYRNGGFSDPSLRESLSNAFGMPVYGGQIVDMGEGMGKSFVLYGAKSDPKTGEAQFAPVALLDDKSVLQVIKRANAGDAMNDAAKEFYASASSRYTPAQLSDFGVSRPGGPMVLGSAEIRSRGPRHSRVSASYFDGEGGYSRMDYDGWTGERQEVRGGTMSPEYPGRWKVLESGPNGKRYENDRTGEVVNVPDGSTLRDVLLRGGSERERIARIQAQGRENAAQIQAQGRAEEQAERKRQFDETLAANKEAKREQMRSQFVGNAVQNITKMLKDSGVAEDKIGDMVQTQLSAMLDQYDKAMGWGNEAQAPAPQGDGTIIGAAGGATGSGGKGGVAQDSNEVRAALLAEKEKRAAKSQGASGGKADGNPPAQKDRGDNNGKQTTISERRKKEYDDGMKEIHANAEKMKNDVGWSGMKKSAKDIETYIKREEYMLKERLRKKYNNIQGAMK